MRISPCVEDRENWPGSQADRGVLATWQMQKAAYLTVSVEFSGNDAATAIRKPDQEMTDDEEPDHS